MTETPASSRDDAALAAAAGRLPGVVGVTLLATAGLLAGMIVLINRPDWWRGLLAAGVISVIAAGVSLVPLLWGLRGGLNRAPAGFLAAMGARFILSLGGCMLAVFAGGYPGIPTVVLMLCFYMAVLAAEVFVLATIDWSAGDKATTKG